MSAAGPAVACGPPNGVTGGVKGRGGVHFRITAAFRLFASQNRFGAVGQFMQSPIPGRKPGIVQHVDRHFFAPYWFNKLRTVASLIVDSIGVQKPRQLRQVPTSRIGSELDELAHQHNSGSTTLAAPLPCSSRQRTFLN